MRDFKRIGFLLFAGISGYLLNFIEGATLVINPSGQTQSRPAGRGFGLTCEGQAEDTDLFTDFKWIGPQGELREGSGPIEVSKVGSQLLLMFKAPTSEDSGMYNCSAVYDSIDKLNDGVNVVFFRDITWEDCPSQQSLVISNDGTIRCRVSANPPAVITWTKNGQPLSNRYVYYSDGIKVSGVTEDDKGEFSVRAMVQQTGRFQDRPIKVEVHVPPEIIELDERMEATEGDEATLRCQASGFPRPIYVWLDPSQRDLSTVDGHIVDQDTGTLTITSVKKENRGSYTCLAKNPAGEAKKSLDISVIVKPEIKEFTNITSVENADAVFECRAVGDPLPELSIRKQGQDRPFDDQDDRIVLTKRDEADQAILSMRIERTTRADDGLYYCTADNKGAQVERVGHLTVEFSPVMGKTPKTSVKTWNGNPVNLTCIAEAIPNATITWSYKEQKIQDNDAFTIYGRTEHSNLLVRPPGDARGMADTYGTYKCQAENSHGSQFINIELQEARTPSYLSDYNSIKETATTITFRFSEPRDDGGLPIRAFVVQYHEENQPYDKAELHEWSEGTPYVLENLKPKTAYKFRFAARNEVGIGDWSDEKRIVMPEESAPESPRFITPGGNVSTYPDRFQIRWTVPLDNGEKIDYFDLRYFETEKKDGQWKRTGEAVERRVKDWENAPLYEMKNLKANTFYKVEVRAHNKIGFSQDATMVFQTATDPSKGTQGRSHIHMPGSDLSHQSNGMYGAESSSLSTGAIAAIIIALVLIILIVVDITCYVRYHWGFVFFLRSRVCAKPMVDEKAKEAAFEDGKGGKGGENEKKTRTEVDNPAFDTEKEPLKVSEESNDGKVRVATEETPMIENSGAKDTKAGDGTTDDIKNKSPKGSKSSIAKDSLV